MIIKREWQEMDRSMIKTIFTSIIVALLLLAAVGAEPMGATPTVGSSERGNGSASGQAGQESGNVTMINLSGIAITTIWGGFYGKVGGSVLLSDASAHKFFEWTVSNFTNSVVYAANDTVNSWDLRAINSSAVPAVVAQGNDNFNHTFTDTGTFQSESIGPIANTPFTRTYQNGAVGSLRTYALVTNDNTVNIWAGVAIQNTSSFKPGENVDYQIICPALTTGTSYRFYMELP
jgi:hypothetical protein